MHDLQWTLLFEVLLEALHSVILKSVKGYSEREDCSDTQVLNHSGPYRSIIHTVNPVKDSDQRRSQASQTDYQAIDPALQQTSMFYQNHSPDVVRRGNGMEYYSNGFCRERNEEKTLKVTLLGHKVMEEKTKFTVYKILVRRAPDERWHIFRRYTDFSGLHDKLKVLFPEFNFVLPAKRWFKNFSAEFLEERQLGLQDFLQNVVADKDMRNSEAVRQFLCLDDPPDFNDIREQWAFCETLERTNCCLQRDPMEDRREYESLRNVLPHKELHISQPQRTKIGTTRTQEDLNKTSRDFSTEKEYKEVERDDLREPNKSSESQFIRSHGACWCGSATDSPEQHSSEKPFQEIHQIN